MKTWCIIDLSEVHDGRGNAPDPMADTVRLDKSHGPTMFYSKKPPSETELFRLQEKHPEGEFFLFEAVGKVVKSNANPKISFIEEPEKI